jgi:hypothetical protein
MTSSNNNAPMVALMTAHMHLFSRFFGRSDKIPAAFRECESHWLGWKRWEMLNALRMMKHSRTRNSCNNLYARLSIKSWLLP